MSARSRALVAGALLVFPACSFPGPPVAIGSLSEVTVFVDRDRPAVASLRAVLERPVDWVGEPEPRFRVAVVHRSGDVVRLSRTLLILGSMRQPDPASRLARDLLGAQPPLASGPFVLTDVYARGQRVFVLLAPESAALDSLAGAGAAALADELDRSALERLRDELLAADRGEPRATELSAARGFLVRAPASYRTSPPAATWPDAVELVRAGPTRILTVFWLDDVDRRAARDSSFVVALERDVLWRLHGDTLAEDRIRIGADRLGPYAALRLDAAWQNARDVAGGPVATCFVHDPARRRLYGIQAQLFAPGVPKLGWMRELLALAATFRTTGER